MKAVLFKKLFPCIIIGGLAGCVGQQSPSTVAAPTPSSGTTISQTIVVKGEDFSPDALLEKLNAKLATIEE